MKLRAGDWVEVRSKEEILGSLDKKGCLDELPVMPQMLEYSGQQFRVYKRAHKTCDTIRRSGGRRLSNAVHLALRCNGRVYGGCQAACLIFWKEAWLKRADKEKEPAGLSSSKQGECGCSEADVVKATCAKNEAGEERYVCQATQLLSFTTRLPWWDPRQYVEDYASGNTNMTQLLRAFSYTCLKRLNRSFAGFRRFHDLVQRLWGGIPYPRRYGTITHGAPTPTAVLDLQPGELVRVKSYEEILATVDTRNKNRGLFFDAELVPYCGGEYRVRARVSKFIDEKTGKMATFKTPAVILEKVWCQSCYSDWRMHCPRSIYSWWREVWLERVHESSQR